MAVVGVRRRDPVTGPTDEHDSPTASRPGPTLATGVGLVLGLIGFVVGAEVITDNSLLTHLATGRLIVDQGSVPTTDPYSATAAGGDWTVQSWLASLVYALSADAIGAGSLRLIHGLAAAMVSLGVWRLVAPARQLIPRVSLAVIPLVLGAGFWSPRPLMFGLLGVVCVLLATERVVPPWTLVPAMWLWVNSHGSFPLAFVLLGALVVGRFLDERRAPLHELRVAAWAAGGALVAGVNPIGPAILWFPFHLLGRREALEEVVEWEAPNFDGPSELLYLSLLGLIVLAAKRGAPWRALLPSLGFLATGFLAIRNINVAVLVLVVLLAPSFRDWFGTLDGGGRGAVPRMLTAVAAVAFVVSGVAVTVSPGVDLKAYPIDEVDELAARGLVADESVTLIHREAVGNYLGFRFGSDARVFIDDRFDFYPLDVTEDHLTLLYGGDHGEILDRRDADVVLWEAEAVLADWLDERPEWDVISRSEDWLIACRVGGPVYDRCR